MPPGVELTWCRWRIGPNRVQATTSIRSHDYNSEDKRGEFLAARKLVHVDAIDIGRVELGKIDFTGGKYVDREHAVLEAPRVLLHS